MTSHTDTSISEIEHRAEKYEFISTNPRHPFRPSRDYDGEIEHVNDLPHQERGITFTERNKIRHVIRRRRIEYETIEHAVNQIAYGPGKYK